MANSVSLCMIVKNEISNIEDLMEDLLPTVEEAHVVDTGSTDGTLEVLAGKKFKYPHLNIHQFDWVNDFSAARNFSFSQATKDWVFWVDGDDRVSTIEFKKFKDHVLDNPGVDAWLLDYIYSRFPDGSPQTTLGRERFLRRSKGPRWIGAVHETVDISCMRQHDYKDLKIIHNRDGKVIDYKRNVTILAKEFERNPSDPRTCYYYGKELFDMVDSRGVEVLEKYLALPVARWFDDEVNARFRLGKAYLAQGRHREAVRMAEEIYHLDPTRKRAEGYWLLGKVEQDLHNFEIAIKWYQRCIDTPPPPPRVLGLEYYTWNPTRRVAECYQAMGNTKLMLEWAQKVQDLLPGDCDTMKWMDSLVPKFKVEPKGGLKVLEVGTQIRTDSTRINDGDPMNLDPESLDGLVTTSNPKNLVQSVKPGGFVWVTSDNVEDLMAPGIQYLGPAKYNGYKVNNFVKPYSNKPSIGIASGDREFGPYRIRQSNLELSAIKAGFNVTVGNVLCPGEDPDDTDYYFSPSLSNSDRGKVKILDLCEELPREVYEYKGIRYADVVTVCTESLQRYVQKLYPQKRTVVVEDHFEFTAEEWL